MIIILDNPQASAYPSPVYTKQNRPVPAPTIPSVCGRFIERTLSSTSLRGFDDPNRSRGIQGAWIGLILVTQGAKYLMICTSVQFQSKPDPHGFLLSLRHGPCWGAARVPSSSKSVRTFLIEHINISQFTDFVKGFRHYFLARLS